jgi:hypothetical protein
MFSYRALRNGVVAAVLVALCSVSAVPAQAQPVRRPSARLVHVAGLGERVWLFLASLWPQDLRKEGMSIDPNGGKDHEGVSIDPNGALSDEGVLIDPNGRT